MQYPRIIAHRCGGLLAPENSLAGLVEAARIGCKAVEFDVMLTADDVPILIHDETLDRTMGCAGSVAELTLAQIRQRAPAVPTLAEAIAECRRLGLWANIELKPSAGHEEETGTLVGAWLAANWDGHGVISSFSEKSALAGRRYLPESPFAMLYEVLPPDWQEVRGSLGAVAVHLDVGHIDVTVAKALTGVLWACYTVNDVDEAERLFALGCQAVFTDRPDLLLPAFA
jgi:glycerophosphoryl diester phosphodiesterase